MASWRKAILLGVFVWLIPFVVAVLASPLKSSWRSLFESIMPLTLAVAVVSCTGLYLRSSPTRGRREGLLLGLIWLAISVAIDLPLMLSPPMNYTLPEYAADIGLTYLMIPVITAGIGGAIARPATPAA